MGPFAKAARTYRTLRHLPPAQLAALVRRRLYTPPLPRAPYFDPLLIPRAVTALGSLGPVNDEPCALASAEAFATGRIEMLGRIASWSGDWRALEHGTPLWRYHLHYHDVLADVAWSVARNSDLAAASTLSRALNAWSITWGDTDGAAWDAYPVAVRLVNWLRVLAWAGPLLDPDIRTRMLALHGRHVTGLAARLEWHLRGNHLLRNASALVIGAASSAYPRISSYRAPAQEIYFDQLADQIDEDGVHQERSPMYHLRALRDGLEVFAVLTAIGITPPQRFRDTLRRMYAAAAFFIRADGTLHLLGDCAHDHGVGLNQLHVCATKLGFAAHPPAELSILREARLLVADNGRQRFFMTFSPPAPAHQPAHAHADALAIEYDLAGMPLLVDPGTTGYDADPLRAYFRGTTAHNTVCISERDQSEMWGTFRVGGRARVEMNAVTGSAADLAAGGSCIPHFDRRSCHERQIRMSRSGLVVRDRVAGAEGSDVRLHWHLHPDWNVTQAGTALELRHESGTIATMRIDGADRITLHRGERAPDLGWYSAGFGRPLACWVVRGHVLHNDGRIVITTVEQHA